MSCNIPPTVQEYIDIVRGGEYAVCNDQLLFCALVERAFAEDDIVVNYEQLDKYLSYERYFPFKLVPWEKCVFTLHCCTYWRADGLPRWPDLFLYVARGAGKNAYMAFEDFCLLTPANGIKHYDIDLCATSEDQAKTSFQDIIEVLEGNPQRFKRFFRWNRERIENLQTGSCLRYRTANAKTKDGGRPGKVDYDEVHAYVSYEQIEVFEGGKGKKPHPRSTIGTTDGKVRGGPLDDYKDTARQVLDGLIEDNGFLPFLCHIEQENEIDDPTMWHKANPTLRYLPNLQKEYNKKYAEYKRDPLKHIEFPIKRMNWVTQAAECPVTSWDNIMAASGQLPEWDFFRGRSCVFGIDYAKTTDMVSAGLLFHIDRHYYWISHSWLCKQSADLQRMQHVPFTAWEKAGLMTVVDEPEIHPDTVAQWLEGQAAKYDIKAGGIDLYRFTLLSKSLREHGFDTDKGGILKLIRKSNIMLTAPVIDSVFNNHAITWGDNPLMRWFTNNTSVVQSKDGNMVYSKIEPRSRKTDGFMAMAAAFAVADALDTEGGTDDDYDFMIYTG